VPQDEAAIKQVDVSGQPVSKEPPTCAVVIHEKLVASTDVEEEEVETMRCFGMIEGRAGRVKRFGVPQLVLIPKQHLKGGHQADTYFLKVGSVGCALALVLCQETAEQRCGQGQW
jgi:hypothetical protein